MSSAMSMIRRQLLLKNEIDRTVYLREVQDFAAEGFYGHEIRLDPKCVKRDFPATVYVDRIKDSGRGSKIVIFVDKDEVLQSLTPENFIQYVELIFSMDEVNKKFVVSGVPVAGWKDEMLRLGAFGFFGRDYSVRKTVIVCSSKFRDAEGHVTVRGVYSQAR